MPSKPPVRRPVCVTVNGRPYRGTYVVVGSTITVSALRRLAACRSRISPSSSSSGSSIYGPRCQPETSLRLWLCDLPVERAWADRACHPGRVGSISERGPVPLPTLAARNASSGPRPAVCVAPGASFRSGDTPRRRGSVAQPKERPCPHRPYQFIAIAGMIARSFTEQTIGHPEGEALTEAARAIWRGSRFLRGGTQMVGKSPTQRGADLAIPPFLQLINSDQ